MSEKTRNLVLLLLIVSFAAAAGATMVPMSAPRRNDMGYFSVCPFAPWSTLSLLLVAGVIWVIRQYFLTRPKSD